MKVEIKLATNSDTRGALHLSKLSVGSTDLDTLSRWQSARVADRIKAGVDPRPRHITRMTPKRSAEVLKGGSIFWVIGGVILCRQPIEALEELRDEEGIRRCAIVFTPKLIRVEPRPKRAFQGWRYLTEADAPPDLIDAYDDEDPLPDGLREAMQQYGLH